MALKFGDTAKPMGAFPVAEAVDIEITKSDDSKKSLQAMYDDGELGGGESLPLPEQADMILVTYENEDGDLNWKQAEISEYTNLDIGSDLNTLVKYGTYRVTTKRVDRIDNVPVQTAGMLEVRVTGSIIYQTYRTIDNDAYIRSSEDVGASWTNWEKFLTDADGKGLPLPEQAGMVMMTYENEDGDLDWKQSLLKTVEKVEEVPTTFEDKVYIYKKDPTQMPFDYKTTTFEGLGAFLNTLELTYEIIPDSKGELYSLTYDDAKYNFSIYNINGDETFDHIHKISVVENDCVVFYTSDGRKLLNTGDNILKYDGMSVSKIAQVYASEVELATKEYADTHGAGAQVYTKAEWDALPIKPPAGTQVIISDDTSGGGSLENNICIADFEAPIAGWLNGATNTSNAITATESGILCVSWNSESTKTELYVYDVDTITATTYSFGTSGDYLHYLNVPITEGHKYYSNRFCDSTFYPFKTTKVTELKAEDKYSTSETVIGEWIDGKPIYRKVLTLDISTTGGHNINVASSNIAQLTTIKGIFNDSQYNYIFPVPDYGDGDTRLYLTYDVANKIVHYEPGAKYGVKGKLIVTIEYTKTTD